MKSRPFRWPIRMHVHFKCVCLWHQHKFTRMHIKWTCIGIGHRNGRDFYSSIMSLCLTLSPSQVFCLAPKHQNTDTHIYWMLFSNRLVAVLCACEFMFVHRIDASLACGRYCECIGDWRALNRMLNRMHSTNRCQKFPTRIIEPLHFCFVLHRHLTSLAVVVHFFHGRILLENFGFFL